MTSAAAIELLRDLATLTIDGDIVNGEEYCADGNEIDALYGFVHRARELLGLDDPKGTDWLARFA